MEENKFDDINKMRNFWFSMENLNREIPKIALLCALFGGIYQFFILLLIGEGSWILSYFSATYALIEGLTYFLYIIAVLIFSIILFELVEDLEFNRDSIFFRVTGISIILFSVSFFFFLGSFFYLRYFLFFMIAPIMIGVFMIRGVKLNILAEFSEATKESNQLLLVMFFSVLVVWSFLNLKINKESYEDLKFVKKQIVKYEKPVSIYMNDQYLFIRFSEDYKKGNAKDNVSIFKIDNL